MRTAIKPPTRRTCIHFNISTYRFRLSPANFVFIHFFFLLAAPRRALRHSTLYTFISRVMKKVLLNFPLDSGKKSGEISVGVRCRREILAARRLEMSELRSRLRRKSQKCTNFSGFFLWLLIGSMSRCVEFDDVDERHFWGQSWNFLTTWNYKFSSQSLLLLR